MATRLEAAILYLHKEVYGWPDGINPNPQNSANAEESDDLEDVDQTDDSPDPPDCDAWALRTQEFINSARALKSASLAAHSPKGENRRRTPASGKLDQRTGAGSARDGKKRVRFNIPDSEELLDDNEPSVPALDLTCQLTGYEFEFPGGQYGPDGNKIFLIWPTSPDQQLSPAPWFAAVSCLSRALHRNVWVGDWDTEVPTQPATDSANEDHEAFYEWQEILAGMGLAFSFRCLRSVDLCISKKLRELVKANRNNPDEEPTVTAIRSAVEDVQIRLDYILDNRDQEYYSELETYEDVIGEVWELTPEGDDPGGQAGHLRKLHEAILEAIQSVKDLLSLVKRARGLISSIESIKAKRRHHAALRYMDGGASIPVANNDAYSVHPSILKAVSEGTNLIETAVREFLEAQVRLAARVADLQDVDEQFDIAAPDESVHPQDLEDDEDDLLVNTCRQWMARLSWEINGICDIYEGYGRAVMEADSALARMAEGVTTEPEPEPDILEKEDDGLDDDNTMEMQRTVPRDLRDPPCLLPDAL